MHSLSFVVLNVFQGENRCEDPGCPAAVNRQAFLELEKWTIECQGRPKRWDQYQEWPSKILPEFLDLVAVGNDTALLILIHWAAVMATSTKPFVKAWAVRAGLSAVSRLEGEWPEQMGWPLEIFAQPVATEHASWQMGAVPVHLQLPSYTGPDQAPAVFNAATFGDAHGLFECTR